MWVEVFCVEFVWGGVGKEEKTRRKNRKSQRYCPQLVENDTTVYEMSLKDKYNYQAKIWKLLKGPFCLPECSMKYHTCQWHVFGGDQAGCLLCGSIHQCRVGGTCPVVETDESEVCEITGVVLGRVCLPIHMEFLDTTVARVNPKMTSNENDSHVPGKVREYVEEILISDKARDAHSKYMSRFEVRMLQNLQASKCLNMVDKFSIAYCKTYEKLPCMFNFSYELRKRVAEWCISHLQCTVMKFHKQMRLNVKSNDLRNTVFGLMYVMRSGISIDNCRIMPRLSILNLILPAESLLDRCFNFKAKMITDVENRCKINFRTYGFSRKDRIGFSEFK